MLCSFHDKDHKIKKFKYKENIPIEKEIISGNHINNKEGFIKVDQLYYFNKSQIDYKVIGQINNEFLEELVKIILRLGKEGKLKIITTNLQKIVVN